MLRNAHRWLWLYVFTHNHLLISLPFKHLIFLISQLSQRHNLASPPPLAAPVAPVSTPPSPPPLAAPVAPSDVAQSDDAPWIPSPSFSWGELLRRSAAMGKGTGAGATARHDGGGLSELRRPRRRTSAGL